MKIPALIAFLLLIAFYRVEAQAPTVGATNFSVANIYGNSLRVNWTRGNGSRVLVLASASPTFNGAGVPADGTDYTANATFGSGNQVGAGNFVVYKNTGTGVTILLQDLLTAQPTISEFMNLMERVLVHNTTQPVYSREMVPHNFLLPLALPI